MSHRTPAIALAFVAGTTLAAAAFAQSAPAPDNGDPLTRSRQLPQYTDSGDLKLPTNWRQWIFVGDPLTPNALNGGHANFPEYHNVYIEPGSYAIYKKTGVFPEGTIFVKELQLTLKPAGKPGWLANRAFGEGFFPRRFQRRRRDRQGYQTLCRIRRLGILQFQSSRAKGSNRQGEGEIGMCILSYRQRQARRGLDSVLPHTGRGPRSPR